jgi:hypothetical protein
VSAPLLDGVRQLAGKGRSAASGSPGLERDLRRSDGQQLAHCSVSDGSLELAQLVQLLMFRPGENGLASRRRLQGTAGGPCRADVSMGAQRRGGLVP